MGGGRLWRPVKDTGERGLAGLGRCAPTCAERVRGGEGRRGRLVLANLHTSHLHLHLVLARLPIK